MPTQYLLMIEHRHGSDSEVHPTEQEALDSLDDFVCRWWEEEVPQWDADFDEPMPEDPAARIAVYFSAVEDESWLIVPVGVQVNAVVSDLLAELLEAEWAAGRLPAKMLAGLGQDWARKLGINWEFDLLPEGCRKALTASGSLAGLTPTVIHNDPLYDLLSKDDGQ